MGKAKKFGVGTVILVMLIMVGIVGASNTDESENKSTGIDKFKSKSHEDMNSSELSLIAVQHDFKDLMRNIDDYSGKIIHNLKRVYFFDTYEI